MKKMRLFNLISSILIMAGCFAFMFTGSIYAKSVTSALFVVMGVVNLIYVLKRGTKNKKFCIFMFIGLFFAFLGDVLLEIIFIVGAGFFALGHIFFLIAYCFISKFNWKDILYSAIIFVPSLAIILFVPIFNFESILMQVVCVIYALVISLMVGKALGNYIKTRSKFCLVILIGSVLFFFSDFMLLFNYFAFHHVAFGALCLTSYYSAEVFLAYSILNSKKR